MTSTHSITFGHGFMATLTRISPTFSHALGDFITRPIDQLAAAAPSLSGQFRVVDVLREDLAWGLRFLLHGVSTYTDVERVLAVDIQEHFDAMAATAATVRATAGSVPSREDLLSALQMWTAELLDALRVNESSMVEAAAVAVPVA